MNSSLLKVAFLIVICLIISTEGCSNTYTIKTSDNFPGEIFVVHTSGDDLKKGMHLSVYNTHYIQAKQTSEHQHGKSGRWEPVQRIQREVIGIVEVTEIIDNTHAKVLIISGKAGNDLEAEPVKE